MIDREKEIQQISKDLVNKITKPLDELLKRFTILMILLFAEISLALLNLESLLPVLLVIQVIFIIYDIVGDKNDK